MPKHIEQLKIKNVMLAVELEDGRGTTPDGLRLELVEDPAQKLPVLPDHLHFALPDAEVARAQGALPAHPNFNAWLDRIHARPAWKRALEKGGEYALGR